MLRSPKQRTATILGSDQETATANSAETANDLLQMVDQLDHEIRALPNKSPAYPTEVVNRLLEFAALVGTSDMHLQPTPSGLDIRFRHDGVLHPIGVYAEGANASIISRLKVLSNLLTYQNDIPQEGRVADPGESAEVRVSTFPTLDGERAV
ncbi:ATPase, T2SS/T4P/T4SS family, partial [Rhodopirellula sallentina]